MKTANWIVLAIIAGLLALLGFGGAPDPEPVEPPVIVDPIIVPGNVPPEIIGGWPMMANTMAGWNDTVRFDANDRGDCAAVDCDDRCFQIFDADGDELVYKWEFYGPDKNGVDVAYTVFSPLEENISGQWTTNKIIGIVVGWPGKEKPRPLVLMGCGPTPPPPTPIPPSETTNMQCKFSVWDRVNPPVSVRWRQLMTLPGCGGD